MSEMLIGDYAPMCRQLAGEMILMAVDQVSTTDANRLRKHDGWSAGRSFRRSIFRRSGLISGVFRFASCFGLR